MQFSVILKIPGDLKRKCLLQVWLRRGGERKRLDLLVKPLQPGDPESKVIKRRENKKKKKLRHDPDLSDPP